MRGFRDLRGLLPLAGCVTSLSACGGKPAPTVAEAPEASVASAVSRHEMPEPPPPSPVEAPADVVARLRVKSPASLVDRAFQMGGVPLDWRALVDRREPDIGRILSSAVDPMLPVEAVVVLSPIVGREPFAVHSYGARGVWPVLRVLDELGVDHQEGPSNVHYFRYEGEDCAVGRALGPAPARVVCAIDETSLRELLPYALAGLPREPLSPAAAYFEFHAAPLQAQYGKQLRALRLGASVMARQFHLDSPRFDHALTDVAVGLATEIEEVLLDVSGVKMELFSESDAFRFEATASFSGRRSWTVLSLDELGRAEGPAPAIFDAIPAVASAAGYTRPLSKERTARARALLGDLVGGYAEAKGASPALTARLERAVAAMMSIDRPTVSASGPLVVVRDAESKVLTPAWSLIGVEGRSEQLVGLFADLAAVLGSPEAKKLVDEPARFARLEKRSVTLRGVPRAIVYEWEVPALGELSDSLADTEISGARLQRLGRGHLAIVEIGGMTWISVGPELETLAEPLRALGNKDTSRIGSDLALAELRSAPRTAGGFVKLDGFVGTFSALIPETLVGKWSSLVESTPNRGRVPMTYELEIREGAQTELVFRQEVPEGFVGDLVALLALAVAED